jgi:hypothetical protein
MWQEAPLKNICRRPTHSGNDQSSATEQQRSKDQSLPRRYRMTGATYLQAKRRPTQLIVCLYTSSTPQRIEVHCASEALFEDRF